MSKEAKATKALEDIKKEFTTLKQDFRHLFDEHKWRQSMYEANFKLLKENNELRERLALLEVKLEEYEGKQ